MVNTLYNITAIFGYFIYYNTVLSQVNTFMEYLTAYFHGNIWRGGIGTVGMAGKGNAVICYYDTSPQ